MLGEVAMNRGMLVGAIAEDMRELGGEVRQVGLELELGAILRVPFWQA